jgi:hypothetical protein
MRSRSLVLLGGTALGVMVGLMTARRWSEQHRANLYSPRPWRRLAALGYLAHQPTVETARLLHDYLQWERSPWLRRRARTVLTRLEAALG